VTARDILDSGASRIESELSTEPDVRATLMRTIGVVYSSIAEYRRGLELVDKAIAVRARARDVQPEELVRDAMSAGGVRFLADDWNGGIRRLEEAAKLQERLAPGNMALRGDLLSDLGRAQTLTAQFGLAERTLRQAIEARKKSGDEAKLADAYGRLAGNFGYQGKYDQAIPLELDALSVLVRLHGEFHPSVISRYNSLARGYTESGRPEEAVKYGEKAVASARKIYDPSHPDLATQLNALGMAYTLAGRWQDCLRTHEEALAIWRKDPDRKANIANGLNNVAKAHLNLGDHDRYYTLTREALAVAREVHSVSPVLVNNWAAALRQRGELDGALTNMQEALAAIVKSLPADHVTIAHLRRNLALVFIDLGRYGEAEPLLREAAAIQSKKLPPNHWMLAWNDALLAECRLAARDLPAARKLSQDAARTLEAAHHPTAAAALATLGRSHLAEVTPDAAQAAGFLTRALEIERQPSGFHDPFTVACAEASLSKAYRKLGRAGEADKLEMSAAALLAKHPSHARLRAALSE
jgi:tetratricopeptide (TPR) repeat protein